MNHLGKLTRPYRIGFYYPDQESDNGELNSDEFVSLYYKYKVQALANKLPFGQATKEQLIKFPEMQSLIEELCDKLDDIGSIQALLMKLNLTGGITGYDGNNIDFEIVNLANLDPNDSFGYQCDTIIVDSSTFPRDTEVLDKIAASNASVIKEEVDKKTGIKSRVIERLGANIISIFHETDFKSDKSAKRLSYDDNDRLKDFSNEYNKHFSCCANSVFLDATESSVVNSLAPEYVRKDIAYSKTIVDLVKNRDISQGKDNVGISKSKVEDIIGKLATMISVTFDNKNPYTKGHSVRVASLSEEIARNMQFTEGEFEKNYPDLKFDDVKQLVYEDPDDPKKSVYTFNKRFTDMVRVIAMAHDIGKIGIPNDILDKGKLTDAEYEVMKKHSAIGKLFFDRLADDIPEIRDYLDLIGNSVEAHHERYDGKGYPKRWKKR